MSFNLLNLKSIQIYYCLSCDGHGTLNNEVEMGLFKRQDCSECGGTGLCESLSE